MPRGRRAQLSAAALGGALAALGLPSWGLWGFAWFALVPLVLASNGAPAPRGAALAGFAAGLAYHVVALHWIYATCRFAQVPAVVAAFAVLGLSALLAASWAAAAALARALSESLPRALRPLVWALCWTAVASAASRFTPRFGVDLLGYTQWSNLALLQGGSWGGPHLLDFVLMLFNASLAEAWLEDRDDRAAAALTASLALAAGVWGHGAYVLAARPDDREPSARVEILQPVVDQYHKWDERWIAEILAGYEDLLSRPRPSPPALVVWPETSIPRWSLRSEPVAESARWAVKLGAQHLVGIIAAADRDGGPANAVQLIAPDGRLDGRYSKRQLVPFGEFVPLRRFVPRFVIDRWLMVLDNLGDMEAGAARQPLLQTAWGPTAVTICYEAIFPRWPRLDAARGARLMINITNDAWYLDTWGPRQHYRVNRFRAIENRLTVIRSGNNGVSAVIDPWGVTTAELALDERGRLDAEIPLRDAFPDRSFYTRHGDWLGALCILLVLAVAPTRFLASTVVDDSRAGDGVDKS
ncbi:MAG: apolipoprotein N-acyltransferase [Elusimicrobia bacterium]|nr:apolipoprotein N-acyltransferase [Elusimicrobiota bacterium]